MLGVKTVKTVLQSIEQVVFSVRCSFKYLTRDSFLNANGTVYVNTFQNYLVNKEKPPIQNIPFVSNVQIYLVHT